MGQGLAINSTPQSPEGIGFGPETAWLGDPARQSARDLWQINEVRRQLLESKGVGDEGALTLSRKARQAIDEAELDARRNQHHDAQAAAQRAQGLAFRAYARSLNTINDLVKAVVLFLMLVIPFCYFLMKLITPFTGINQQILLFAAIFLGMALLLHLVHPAFAVARTPVMVLLAFVILGLAGFVAAILISRFNESLTQVVEALERSEATEAPRSRLAGVAFVVGVNNMKRRRIGTTLTCATIVLVTFTMLSVISVRQEVAPIERRLGARAPYNGWLYCRSGLRPLDDLQVDRLRTQFQNRARSVARYWVQRLGQHGKYLAYRIEPLQQRTEALQAQLEAKVVLGMQVDEDGFIDRMPLVAGGRWFSADDAAEIVISQQAARFCGLEPADAGRAKLVLDGQVLTLVGLIDDERFGQMRDLGDVPLVPLVTDPKFQTSAESDASDLMAQQSGSAQLQEHADLLGAPGVHLAEPREVAIVPLERARAMEHGRYRSISFQYDARNGQPHDAALQAWQDANDLILFQHARVSVGLDHRVELEQSGRTIGAGQYALASSTTTQVTGLLKVMIPIILAATIILNTMLGSVVQRKREVAIYNAIGLNPGHVVMFFLAESLVFGVVGSVAGYIIGQGLSLLLSGWIGLNLNYSSFSVMLVIVLAVATVMISTIYPALMAARAAVPSGQRRWSVPQPEGDQIQVDFPFSYDASRVVGVCAYLHEFMMQNTEASTGRFLARPGPMGTVPMAGPDEAHRADGQEPAHAYAMLYDVAPAPFDLGVNQSVEVYAFYQPKVRAHMLAVHLVRRSGQRHNWVHVNQSFLEMLRKRLLNWRSQRPEHQQAYYQRGLRMFAEVPSLPVV